MSTLLRLFLFALALGAALPAAAADARVEQELRALVFATGAVALRGPEHDGLAAKLDEARRFYRAKGPEPVWWSDGAWSPRARAAVRALQEAGREGLDPGDYLVGVTPALPEDGPPARIAEAELLLSAGLLHYIVDVGAGQLAPKEVDPELYVYPRRIDAAAALAAGLAAPDFDAWLASLPPRGEGYARLRDALARYRALAAAGGWPRLPDGPNLAAGDRDPRVAILRRQLGVVGDLAAEPAPAGPSESREFDAALDGAVRRFQRRHGLVVDGVVGPRTRAALDLGAEARVVQIRLNMERLRWIEEDPVSRYIVVNIAGFELRAIENGRTVHKMPVIAGRESRRTPVFSDRMTDLVFLPSWTVPPRIARRDLLPKLKRDPDYLARENIRVFESWASDACEVDPEGIDWASISPRELTYKFKQEPGPRNPLGRVRFTLSNRFDIYLHDTPNLRLFERPARAFSSGCIRVGDARALAAFALQGNVNWPQARIEAAMSQPETQVVPLHEPLAVYVTYMTAWVDEDGTLNFRDDVYGRDRLLAEALGLGFGS